MNLGRDFDRIDASPFPFPLATATLFFGRCFFDDFLSSGDTNAGSFIRDKFRLELDVEDDVGLEDCFALRRTGVPGDVALRAFFFFAVDAADVIDDCGDGDFLRAGDDCPTLDDFPDRRFGAAFDDADELLLPVLPMVYKK